MESTTGQSTKICNAKDCEKVFPNKKAYEIHWDQEHAEILLKKCHYCDFENRKRLTVEEHIFQKHSSKPRLYALTCPKCDDFRATNEDLIKIHLIENCPGKRLQVMNTSPTKLVISKKSFVCHLCPFKTENCKELGHHLVQHHLNCCSHCDLKSVSKDFIEDHISDSHSELIIKKVAVEVTLQKVNHVTNSTSSSSSGSKKDDVDKSRCEKEKENFDVDLHQYPSRKRKAKHLGLRNENERNASLLPSARKKKNNPLAKVHKRRRTASEQQTTNGQKSLSDDKKGDSKEKKAETVPVVIPLSPRSHQELRKQFPEDFEGVTDQLLKEQELYLPYSIKPLIRGRRCLTCNYLGPVRFDTVRHVLLRHLRIHLFVCNHCPSQYHKLSDLKKHFFQLHYKKIPENPSTVELTASPNSKKDELNASRNLTLQFEKSTENSKINVPLQSSHLSTNFPNASNCPKGIISLKLTNGAEELPAESNQARDEKDSTDFTRDILPEKEEEEPKEDICTVASSPKKKTVMKTTRKRETRDLYKLVMKPVLNEDLAETSFERLVPLIKNFYHCVVCKWKFELLDEFTKHNCHHEKPAAEATKADHQQDTNKKFVLGVLISGNNTQCTICSFQTSNYHQLEEHVENRHVDLKENRCRACNWQHQDSRVLVNHIKLKHLMSNASHLCQRCHVTFSSKSELQIHVLTEHAFKCALCNFTAKYDGLLVAHVQANHKDKHTDEVIVDYNCLKCNFKGNDAMELSRHLRDNHSAIECLYCGEIRSSASSTWRHIDTVHLDIRKFPCPTCNHRFTCSRDLNNHLKVHTATAIPIAKGKKVAIE